jgi:hypothetical protein
MRKWLGLALGGALVAACGHGVPTGNYANNYTTPTGYANAQHPNVMDNGPGNNPPRGHVASRYQREVPPPENPPPPEQVPMDTPAPGDVQSPTTP